eukprot:gnl/MRDRNA2_/MRDRNA2_28598_c0_seq1.p1 gnl/MRDRNA2_/MRDRNA2_28598_c0~~gnl/MRDRNA2_/MRDRNA2_28598_c0_seq1.p1  ORF type:complete len:124 (+),score=27.11 gnl/MRDRNA2_/MRDRNA2_28598_c0_seq1:87-458(+)
MFFAKETAALVPKAAEEQIQKSIFNNFKSNLLSGGTSAFAVVVVIYFIVAALHSLIFSFKYSIYSLGVAGLVALGETPMLLSYTPAGQYLNMDVVSTYLTPKGKVLCMERGLLVAYCSSSPTA